MRKVNIQSIIIIVIAFILCVSTITLAQDKVVVVPLFSSETGAIVTRFASIPPASFLPRWPADTGYFIGSSGELIVNSGTEDQFHAPVALPDGATIVAMHAWVTDTSLFGPPVGSLEIILFGLRYDGGYTNMLSVVSSYQPSPTKLTDTTFNSTAPQFVDNENWMYVVRVRATGDSWASLGSALQLEGVTIEYTVTE